MGVSRGLKPRAKSCSPLRGKKPSQTLLILAPFGTGHEWPFFGGRDALLDALPRDPALHVQGRWICALPQNQRITQLGNIQISDCLLTNSNRRVPPRERAMNIKNTEAASIRTVLGPLRDLFLHIDYKASFLYSASPSFFAKPFLKGSHETSKFNPRRPKTGWNFQSVVKVFASMQPSSKSWNTLLNKETNNAFKATI